MKNKIKLFWHDLEEGNKATDRALGLGWSIVLFSIIIL